LERNELRTLLESVRDGRVGVEHLHDVRVFDLRKGPRLLQKASSLTRFIFRQNLEGDGLTNPFVHSGIDLAHASAT
jgi:hypothetical protein